MIHILNPVQCLLIPDDEKTLRSTHAHGNCMTILTLLFNEKKLRDYELVNGRKLTIGRSPDNDVIIDNPAVSGHHARVESVVSSFVLRDLGSTNGTFVNKQRVESHVLHHDDVVMIGKHKLIFNVLDSLEPSENGEKGDRAKPAYDVLFEDKTRFLDTREHRDLIRQPNGTPPAGTAESTMYNNSESGKRIFATLWKKILRLFTGA